jgi:hypothetical protein
MNAATAMLLQALPAGRTGYAMAPENANLLEDLAITILHATHHKKPVPAPTAKEDRTAARLDKSAEVAHADKLQQQLQTVGQPQPQAEAGLRQPQSNQAPVQALLQPDMRILYTHALAVADV